MFHFLVTCRDAFASLGGGSKQALCRHVEALCSLGLAESHGATRKLFSVVLVSIDYCRPHDASK